MSAVIPAKLIQPTSPDEKLKGGAVSLYVKKVTIPRNPINRLNPASRRDRIWGLKNNCIKFTYNLVSFLRFFDFSSCFSTRDRKVIAEREKRIKATILNESCQPIIEVIIPIETLPKMTPNVPDATIDPIYMPILFFGEIFAMCGNMDAGIKAAQIPINAMAVINKVK